VDKIYQIYQNKIKLFVIALKNELFLFFFFQDFFSRDLIYICFFIVFFILKSIIFIFYYRKNEIWTKNV